MKLLNKTVLLSLALGIMTLAASFASLADDGGPVDRIVLEAKADIQVGKTRSVTDFSFTVLSEGCEFWGADLMNKDGVWGNNDIPRVIVYLRSDNGDFTVTRSGIRVDGAECEYAYYDAGLMYVMQLRFPSLETQVGEVGEALWSSSTTAAWSPAYNAGDYEVEIYCDGRLQGAVTCPAATSCELGSLIRREGTYYFRVRAVNRKDKLIKSAWRDSASLTVDSAAAAANCAKYPLQPGYGPVPAAMVTEPYYKDMYGWILEGVRWWYRNADGSYTTDDWQYIDGQWYYFDSKGYMVTGWIDWNGKSYYCDPDSGAMLVNTVVPDGLGRRVDSTGAMME